MVKESMLDLWAKHHEEFVELVDKVDLLASMGFNVCKIIEKDEDYSRLVGVTDTEIERAFCKKYGIDQNQLEKERRKLLEDFTKSNGG